MRAIRTAAIVVAANLVKIYAVTSVVVVVAVAMLTTLPT